MDSTPFVDAFQEVNSRMLGLVGSLSALRELSGVEVNSKSEAEILTASLEIIIENFDLDYVVVHKIIEDEILLAASVGWELMDATQKHYHQTRIDTLADNVITQRDEYNNSVTENTDEGSLIGLPLMANNKLIGVLSACHPHADFFSMEHQRSLVIFCNFLAQSIISHRLISDMQSQIEERTEQLEFALEEALSLKARYEALAVVDELTGLHNRRFFFPETRAVLSRAIRYSETLCLLMLGINDFNTVNNRFGHEMGDEVLVDLADLLKAEARESDIIARIGGGEFILALPVTEFEGAQVLADRISREAGCLSWECQEEVFSISVSTGIVEYQPKSEEDITLLLEELLRQADMALRDKKQKHKVQGQTEEQLAHS